MDSLLRDVRFAWRSIRRRPGVTLVAALSIAVGIGATTAVFSVADTLLLSAPPGIGEPDRVVEVGRTTRGSGFDTHAYPDFLDLREAETPFEELSAWRLWPASMSLGEGGERATGFAVSGNYFETMGVRPAAGRLLRPDDDRDPGAAPVVVLSHRFWEERFAADPGVVGRSLRLNRQPFTVVGVAAEGFRGHAGGIPGDLWVPFERTWRLFHDPSQLEQRGSVWLQVLGRLAPGATLEEADAAVKTVFARLAEAHPGSNARRGAAVTPLRIVPGGGRTAVTGFLAILGTLVTLVLLVTCTNVGGMLLARSAAREKELAVRLALGSGRAGLVRSLLAEALLLFLAGGAGGILLAWWAVGSIGLDFLPAPVPFALDFTPDPLVLGAGLAATLVTGVAVGLGPALRASRPDLVPALKDAGRGGGSREGRLRRIFVGAQVTFSVILLAAAGLFLRSLQEAAAIDAGFDSEGVRVTTVDLDLEGYETPAEGTTFYRTLLRRLEEEPGVARAAVAGDLPLDLGSKGTVAVPEGWDASSEERGIGVEYNQVSPGYFEVLEIDVLRGRAFEPGDREGSVRVAMVNRTFARRAWPGKDPLGRRFAFGSTTGGEGLTVVGVVGEVKNQTLAETPDPFVYIPIEQRYSASVHLVVRSAPGSGGIADERIRRTILSVDPSISTTRIDPMARYTGLGLLPQRIAAGVTGILGLVALLLSGIGVYGIVAFSAARRTREIGVRMALGADRGRILRLILKGGLVVAGPGILLGTLAALGGARLLRALLVGVAPTDPWALAGAAVFLLAVALGASAVPALRASRTEPLEALRYE